MPPTREIKISRLQKRREGVERNLFSLKKWFANLEDPENSPVDIEVRMDDLKLTKTTFVEIQSLLDELYEIDIERSLHEDDKHISEFDKDYYGLLASMQKILNNTATAGTSTLLDISTRDTSHFQPQQLSLKLPEISLPEFTGRIEDWETFKQSFRSLVHNDVRLGTIQKFYYLKGALKALEAKDLIASLELNADNYNVAWKLLEERFENKTSLIFRHIQCLFEMKKVDTSSASSMRSLLDNMQKHVRGLKASQVEIPDVMLIYLVSAKIDQETHQQWEYQEALERNSNELPKFENLREFLLARCRGLENHHYFLTQISNPQVSSHNNNAKTINNSKWRQPAHQKSMVVSNNYNGEKRRCVFCDKEHYTTSCEDFLKLSSPERHAKVEKLKLCFNCLSSRHIIRDCKSHYTCRTCNKKHHSLLHRDVVQVSSDVTPSTSLVTQHQSRKQIFLSTAIIDVNDKYNRSHQCRVLLDSASHSNFISERMRQLLGISRKNANVEVTGFNLNKTSIKHMIKTTIKSRSSDYAAALEFLVIPSITSNLPETTISVNDWKLPNGIQLADPQFNIKGRIDMLIGAEIFLDIIWQGKIELSRTHPILQNTAFGWIVSGQFVQEINSPLKVHCQLNLMEKLDTKLQRFWELEKCDYIYDNLTSDERACEADYVANTQRNKDGRYIVKMPLNANPGQLGDSKFMALKRLESLERRLDKDPLTKNLYQEFIKEYKELGHLEEVPIEVNHDSSKVQYLPHHCVLRPSSTTTKLRVVFDASAKTKSGISLNDIQHTGAKVQQDLFPIMIRIRKHHYAMIADVVKMFRQIIMHDSHCDLQRILWKDGNNIIAYRLKTVTYGTSSAPFLAARTLKQLALDEQHNFPLASAVLLRDFYVDDLMTGTNNVKEAIILQKEMIALFKCAGMELSKWCSNHPDILAHLPESMKQQLVHFNQEDDCTVKALGMYWKPSSDTFLFKVNKSDGTRSLNKRQVLSELASLFDPLGLLGPTIVKAKIFMQQLWHKKLDWNEQLSIEDSTLWKKFQEELVAINDIRIDRCLSTLINVVQYQLHGFSDASEVAFGACIYLRAISSNNQVSTQLICSKSRVAPLKLQTIPRLELCGAQLLAKLMNTVTEALNMTIEATYYWTDSTIVLCWIRGSSSRFKVFVGNRITELQSITRPEDWRHVRTDVNPADCLSRGLTPTELNNLELWWKGPKFLHQPAISFPINFDTNFEELPEQRSIKIVLTTTSDNKEGISSYIERFESHSRMIRVTAFILRFASNCKIMVKNRKNNLISSQTKTPSKQSTNKMTFIPSISTKELCDSQLLIVKQIQKDEFKEDIKNLINNKPVENASKLKLLNPFLDKDNIIRVGGRIKNSLVPYNQKHPILLPQNNHYTKTFIKYEHLRHLHAGTQATLAAVRQKYWPINGKVAVKAVTNKCHGCRRVSAQSPSQLMSDLPQLRVQQCRAFKNAGVDFCGPFSTKNKNQRAGAIHKTYISVFVCFATKAIHLEVVSDLTSASFKAALIRFISRRGICSNLHSDHGTNFVGTHNERKDFMKFITNHETNKEITEFCNSTNINWHFIPPRSPHHGGIWEAAVKSVKHHLKRVMKDAIMSFEELTTLATQIEACLNSRPLTPLSSDPKDMEALTPGHFLVFEPLTTLPDHSLINLKINRLTRWQLVQQKVQSFWKQWSVEYLNELQQRKKWSKVQPNIKVDDLVIIKEDNLPCTQWLLGRVTAVHTGTDSKVRVVSVLTKNGIKERAITKLVLLSNEL